MSRKKTFYRKHYTGYTTGTLRGRDDGYPVPRAITFDTPEELAMDRARRDERYELVTEEVFPLAPEDVKGLIAQGQETIRRREKEAKRRADEKEFARLKAIFEDD